MVEHYFKRFGWCPRQIASPPPAGLGLVVVIPCFNEPGLLDALNALARCTPPSRDVEIIVVVNSGENAPSEILAQNRASLIQAKAWIAEHSSPRFAAHLLDFPALPAKHAGVGLARKIGMDEALRRFAAVNRLDGVILCFDADCGCDPNYLVEVERHFAEHPRSPGCSIYFEHPLDSEAIALYELHLRYYVQGLRFAGFPHAYHTIGSSMAVRVDAYLKQGGMNKRKAGEDFYFLHKIIPLGNFGEINRTRVVPSPRASDRVPFGTGRAVREYQRGEAMTTYPLRAFDDLRELFAQVPALFASDPRRMPPAIEAFLATVDFPAALAEIRSNTTSPQAFAKRFFRWFDGFLAMKFIHFARDRHHGSADVTDAARSMLERFGIADSDPLARYRELQSGTLPIKNAEESSSLGVESL